MAGCAADPPPAPISRGDPWRGTVTTEAGVTTVVNEAGSVWQGTAVLVEEASIGVAWGRDPYMFGRIGGVAASEEHIYVADRQVGALRQYDWNGSHVRDFGRAGQGPGEFQSAASVGVDGAGRVWLDDMMGARVLVYTTDGEPIATLRKEPPLVSGPAPIVVTADGRAFVLALERTPEGRPFLRGRRSYAMDGTVGDFVAFPDFPRPPAFEVESPDRSRVSFVDVPLYPRGVSALAPMPALLSGYPDDYRYRVERPDGSTLIVRRVGALVANDPDEIEARRLAATDFLKSVNPSWEWPGTPIPDTKPAYTALIPAVSGEVWVVRQGPSERIPGCEEADFESDGDVHCWNTRQIVDVFAPDGRFQGDVVVPGDLVLAQYGVPPFIRGTDVIGVVEDEDGTARVRRYRMVLPERTGESNR